MRFLFVLVFVMFLAPGCKGDAGPNGPMGTMGNVGDEGDPGVSCWDANANGSCDLGTEDVNGDSACDVLDCVGPKGDQGDSHWTGDATAISYPGSVGVGGAAPNATMSVQGALNQPLSGTVSTAAGNVVVTGTGTAFQDELDVGDALRIDAETFTVASITDQSTLAVDVAPVTSVANTSAFSDSDLMSVADGATKSKLVVDKSGKVGIGTATPDEVLDVAGGAIRISNHGIRHVESTLWMTHHCSPGPVTCDGQCAMPPTGEALGGICVTAARQSTTGGASTKVTCDVAFACITCLCMGRTRFAVP